MSRRTALDAEESGIGSMRKEKDAWFAGSDESPLPHEVRHGFKGLSYYPYDSKFRLTATFTLMPTQREMMMATSTGREKKFIEYGRLDFVTAGEACSLMADTKVKDPHEHVHEHGPQRLFMMFRDATSGTETYGACRYFDLAESDRRETVIDFNTAYNPFCAYSERHTCPLPPGENWLKVPIRAGEKALAK